jgi:hypothetical protein
MPWEKPDEKVAGGFQKLAAILMQIYVENLSAAPQRL